MPRLSRTILHLPRNRVFRLTMFGRSGRLVRAAFLILLIVESAVIIRMDYRGAVTKDFVEYFMLSIMWHSLAAPFLLLGGMWTFLRPISNAQKEDLWLTLLRPGDVVLGVMAPPALAAGLVIFGLPIVLSIHGASFHVEEFLQTVWDVLFYKRPISELFVSPTRISGSELVAMMAISTLYLVVMLSFWRVVQEGLIRTGMLRIIVVVRALFAAVLVGVIAFEVELYFLVFAHSGSLFRRVGVIEFTLSTLAFSAVLLPAVAGIVVSLRQYPGRRWFAGVVASIEDDEDWLSSEASALAMSGPTRSRLRSPLGAQQLAFLPGAVFGGLVAAAIAGALFSLVEDRGLVLHDSGFFNDDMYMVPTVLLAGMLGGLLGLHRGKFLSWRRQFLIQPGRVAASIRSTAFVSALSSHVPAMIACMFMTGLDADDLLSNVLPVLLYFLVTFPPIWCLHCFLLCAWRLPQSRRVTTVVAVATILGLTAVLWYPGLDWSMFLVVVLMLMPAGAVFFWVCGGSYWFFQKLFEQERSLGSRQAPGL
jgi:hypothetical protein